MQIHEQTDIQIHEQTDIQTDRQKRSGTTAERGRNTLKSVEAQEEPNLAAEGLEVGGLGLGELHRKPLARRRAPARRRRRGTRCRRRGPAVIKSSFSFAII